MGYTLTLVIKLVIAIVLAVIIGNGSVVVFNHFPSKWFEDTDDNGERNLPDKLLKSIEEGRQRLPSTPWKFAFTAFFGIAGVFMALREPLQYLVGAMIVMAVVLEMAISDALYQRVPDQLHMLLALSAVGFVGLYDLWWEPFAGAGIGLLLGLAVYGLGRLIYKKETIGGADLKFYISMGLVAGRTGICVIFAVTTLLSAFYAAYRALMLKDIAKDSAVPMLPFAFVAVSVYMIFLFSVVDVLIL